jgi:sec-independent protein translocase protein TatA
MFGISGEHLIILGIVLLFFGPRRLPELGHTLGKAFRNFKDAMAGIEEASYRKVEEEKKDPREPKDSQKENLHG